MRRKVKAAGTGRSRSNRAQGRQSAGLLGRNERGVSTATGKGKWQAMQVGRVRERLATGLDLTSRERGLGHWFAALTHIDQRIVGRARRDSARSGRVHAQSTIRLAVALH
jgi:hypothetical protein